MGGKTSTSTSTVSIPKWVRDRYIAVNERAEAAASKPFQIYSNDPAAFVAQLNEQQQQGIQNVNAAAGAYQPYFEAATQAGIAGMGSAQPQDLNLEQFYNPFQQQVIDATMKQMTQANEQAQSGALGQAASSGAFGGDRAGIAAANLANQQGLSMGSTLAGLNAQNYNQALAAAQQQQQLYLGATQADLARLAQGGQFLAGLGTAAQQAGLAGAEAQINAGTLQQQTEQAGKTALYNQFQQQQAYDFQVAQFLANIAMGTGALSGSTTTTTQPSSWFSDRRLKEDIRRIGHTDDGLPIYKYKYKGDDNHQTHIGFMADEVEQVKPEAVGVSGGYKTVDYDRATKADGGGVAGPYGAQFGSQSPYAGGYVPQAVLPVGELIVADSNLMENADANMAAQLDAAARFGENIVSLRENYGKLTGKNAAPADPTTKTEPTQDLNPTTTWRGGVVGYASGGPAYLQQGVAGAQNPVGGQSYLADTVKEQERKKPELMTANAAPQARSTMDDIGSLASTAASIATIFAGSDRRMKHDIRRIGRTDHGLPIYSFKYKGDDREQTHIGFMADEVEKEHPGAVMTGRDGYKRVDYGQAHKFYRGGVARPAFADGGTGPESEGESWAKTFHPLRDFAVRRLPNAAASIGTLGEAGVRNLVGLGAAAVGAPDAADYMFRTSDEARAAQRQYSAEANSATPPYEWTGTGVGYEQHMRDIADMTRQNEAIRHPNNRTYGEFRDPAVNIPIAPGTIYDPRETPWGRVQRLGVAEYNRLLDEGAFDPNRQPEPGVAPTRGQGGGGADRMTERHYETIDTPAGRQVIGSPVPAPRPEGVVYTPPGNPDDAPYTAPGTEPMPGVPGGVMPSTRAEGGGGADRMPVYTPPAPPLPLGGGGADRMALPRPTARLTAPAPGGVAGGTAGVGGGGADRMPVPAAPAAPAAGVAPAGVVNPPSTSDIEPMGFVGVAGAGNGWTDVIRPDGTVERREGARNWRNNNPGNIEYGEFAKANGAIGSDGRFAVFPTYEAGRAAKSNLLFGSEAYANQSIAGAIAKYAPAADGNDTAGYTARVAAALGVDPNTPLSALTPAQREVMLTAMEREEGGGAGNERAFGTYRTYEGGVAPANLSTSGMPDARVPVRDRAYEDRNFLGKMFYDRQGNVNKDAILSILSGLGTMASSPSRYFGSALLQGIGGAANTYAGLEKMRSDIAETQARTAETQVRTDASRFFKIGEDGMPMVIIGPGQAVTLAEYLKNPAAFSTGNPQLDAQILSTARERAASNPAAATTAQAGISPTNVRWSQASQDALNQANAAVLTQAGTMNFTGNTKAVSELVGEANQASMDAVAGKPNVNELALIVGSSIGDNNMGTATGYLSNNVVPLVNAALRTVGVEPVNFMGADADDQATILRKLQALNGAALTPEQERAASVFQMFANVSPDLTMSPEAAATVSAGIMLQNQQAIDEANYYNFFQGRADAGFPPNYMLQGYAGDYAAIHQIEKDNLKNLFLLAADQTVINDQTGKTRGQMVEDFLSAANSGIMSQEQAQAILNTILGSENTSQALARYFITGM